ncbi:alpha/beta fold hydrolase [Marinivivus vitaminiproducens]|uniref:alpha/beta fold hydrolase n=1 Tax=Marinivivus vitaminiproducens TaxID=3035935 RepID=UPI0027A85060|nr:alpha/beta hydrolase [Geminicoccaceae bacterium SCSIO 64248]
MRAYDHHFMPRGGDMIRTAILAATVATGAAGPAVSQPATNVPESALAPERAGTDEWQIAFDRTFRHHRTWVGDVRLHYVRGGRGEPLILLHGWPTTWYEWRRIMPMLAERYEVIAVDTRGLGDSSRPASGYDKETLADDIAGLIRALDLPVVNIAGHDLGAQIVLAFARNHADMTRRAALLDVPLPGLTDWEASQYWHFTLQSTPDIPDILVRGHEREYLGFFYAGVAHNPSAFTQADIDEFMRTYLQPGAMRAGFDYYRAFSHDAEVNRGWAQAGGRLEMPVLWLGGRSATNDAPGRSAEAAGTEDLLGRQLAPVASDLQGEVFEECGHWLSTECPERTAERLIRFFGEGR